jgi:hypothetical protein
VRHDQARHRYERRAYTDGPGAADSSKTRGALASSGGPTAQHGNAVPARRQHHGQGIARAYRWKRLLESGQFARVPEVAEAEKITSPTFAGSLRLTLLAPDMSRRFWTDGIPICGESTG